LPGTPSGWKWLTRQLAGCWPGLDLRAWARGQYQQARPIAEQAVAVTEVALGQDDPQVGWRCDNLGRVLQDLGDLEGARVQLEQALAIGEATLGPNHPTSTAIRGKLASVIRALQEPPPGDQRCASRVIP
jgi:tetratricopeptide (TPR) repeat protein